MADKKSKHFLGYQFNVLRILSYRRRKWLSAEEIKNIMGTGNPESFIQEILKNLLSYKFVEEYIAKNISENSPAKLQYQITDEGYKMYKELAFKKKFSSE